MGLFGLFTKEEKESLDKGLEKTKSGLLSRIARSVVGKASIDDEVLDHLEEALVSSDVGVETTLKIVARLQERVRRDKYMGTGELNSILKEEISGLMAENNSGESSDFDLPAGVRPYVIMVVGNARGIYVYKITAVTDLVGNAPNFI